MGPHCLRILSIIKKRFEVSKLVLIYYAKIGISQLILVSFPYLFRGVRCVYTECDKNFRTYSDVGYETVSGYDVKLRHFARHFSIQS